MKIRKNILLIVIDCLRADFIYTDKIVYIPTIKRIKKHGFSFLNTISSTTTSTPVFSSLLTGLYPYQNGVRTHSGYSLRKDINTFPELLKQNGYNTYAEVTGPLVKEIGLSKGFDEYNYRDRDETIHSKWGEDLLKKFKNQYKKPWFVLLHIWPLHEPRIIINECNTKKHGDNTYARALSSIDHYLAQLIKIIDKNTLIIFTGDHGEQIAFSRFDKFQKKNREKIFRFKKKYLKRFQINKESFSKKIRNFKIGHGYSIYDNLVKIPLIFYSKNVVPAGESECQIRQIDIFPTIMDVLGLKYNVKTTGKSALPIIEGEDNTHRDAYIEAVGVTIPSKDEWLAGLRINNRYKYIYYPFRKDFDDELYDLEKDPEEKHNIASNNKQLIKTFKKKIKEMKTEKLVGEKIDDEDQEKMIERLKSLGYFD